jgi:hypothetical protein
MIKVKCTCNLGLNLLICASLHTFARQTDTLHQYLNLTTTGTYNQTEITRSYLFSNSLNYSINKKTIKSDLQSRWLFGKQEELLVNNDLYNSLYLNWYNSVPNFNYWLLLNYNSIFSLKINNQLQYGLGVAYNLIHRSSIVLNISDGLIHEYSDIYLVNAERSIYAVFRNSLRLQIRFGLGDRLNVSSVAFLQNSLKDQNDYILKEEGTLSYKLKTWLSLSVKFTYDRMNLTARENIFLTYGLTFERRIN